MKAGDFSPAEVQDSNNHKNSHANVSLWHKSERLSEMILICSYCRVLSSKVRNTLVNHIRPYISNKLR